MRHGTATYDPINHANTPASEAALWPRAARLNTLCGELHGEVARLNTILDESEKRLTALLRPIPPMAMPSETSVGALGYDQVRSAPAPTVLASPFSDELATIGRNYSDLIGQLVTLQSRILNLVDRIEL
jgi:hypothetical protein